MLLMEIVENNFVLSLPLNVINAELLSDTYLGTISGNNYHRVLNIDI